ncbi:MAG: DUF423 domain-containing protein [Gammaproteobacteria bacterium]|nr:DUF423 domain-containing protein [Gammaproteobacteria bacterium]
MSQRLIALGALNCFLAVALGAFAAHGLQQVVSARALQTFQTGVDYHFMHALGLILIGILAKHWPRAVISGGLMLAGIVLFSGSLYVLSLSGIKALGMITPFGGLCFLGAWLWLAWLSMQQPRDD